jgi:hypothetical protein
VTTRILLALIALLLAACADEVSTSTTSLPSETAPERCGTVLTPDAELLEETTRVAARWSAATGCDVRVGEGGAPVRLVPEIIDNGEAVPGFTLPLEGGGFEIIVSPLRFDPRAAPNDGVLAHELGHVLHPRDGHVEAQPGFVACTPLMCGNGGQGLITQADLEYVCAGYDCAAFVPEV